MTVTPKPWLRFYSKGVPESIDYPNVPLYSLLTESAKKYSQRTALEFQGKKISYQELNELTNRFAHGLMSLGISKGSRVAVILPNIPQFVFCYYGVLKTGATAVPCNPLYREKELDFQLQDSGCEAVILLNNIMGPNDFFAEFEKCRPRLKKVKHVFVTSLTDYLPPIKKQLAGPVRKIRTVRRPQTTELIKFLSNHSPKEPHHDPKFIDPKNDIASLQYTGGTTGSSKGAMLTHYNVVTNAIVSTVWSGLPEGSERALAVIPFFHIFGMTVAMNSPIQAGQSVILLPTFHVKEVLDILQKEKISLFPGVSTMYIALLNHPELAKYDLRTVKRCLSGAAPLPYEVQKKFNQITGGNLVEGYGLTEASPVTHCNPFGDGALVKAGSIGIPLPDTDAKIVDLETGERDLPTGEVGELAVKGPQVMKGYWNNLSETENIMRDEWLLTGDIAKVDEDGYFYIVDRKKDMIDASGFKVWPREVEEVLFEHPDVKEAAVVGVRDPYRIENVKAYIVLKDRNKNPGTDAIRQFCKDRLTPYKVPRIIEFRDELPKTLVGKVLRRKLREEEDQKSSA